MMEEKEALPNKEGEQQEAEKSAPEINPEEVKKEAIQEVAKFQEAIANKTKELVGEGPAMPDLPERDVVRRKLMEAGILSSKASESLGVAYKEYKGGNVTLGGLKQELGRYTEGHPLAGLREIPDHAIGIEDKAMGVVGDCENGWAQVSAFRGALSEEIDNAKIEQLGKEKGMELSPNEQKKGLAGLEKSIRASKGAMLNQMMSYSGELPEAVNREKERLQALRSSGVSMSEAVDRVRSDQIGAKNLDSALLAFRESVKQKRDANTSEALHNLRRAEIVGVVNSSESSDIERKLG